MRTKLRSKVTLLFMTLGLVLAVPAVALADQVGNNLDNTVDATLETMNLTAGGATGSAKIYVKPANTYVTDPATGATAPDGKNGCNLTGDNNLTVSATSTNPSVATVSAPVSMANPASSAITGCDDPKAENQFLIENGATLTVTPLAQGSTTINVSGPGSITVGSETRYFDYLANFTVNVAAAPVTNNAPTVVQPGAADANGNEGDTLQTSGAFADQDGDTLTITQLSGAGTVTPSTTNPGEWSWSLPTTDNDSGTVVVQANDNKPGGTVTDEFNWSATNVAPTVTGISASVQNALAGNKVTFTGTATDPSTADTTAGFFWKWAVDGGTFGSYGSQGANTFQTSFSSCGSHNVSAIAKDKDNGVSPAVNSGSVNVYSAPFKAPLVDGSVNTVQKGRVIPVKVSVGCGTNLLTGLAPRIDLLSGDVSPENEIGATAVTTSVSSADSGQLMREVDGGYIYNLQVPSVAGKYTIRVNPWGAQTTLAAWAASSNYVVLDVRSK